MRQTVFCDNVNLFQQAFHDILKRKVRTPYTNISDIEMARIIGMFEMEVS